MGRPIIKIDDESLWDMANKGLNQKEIASELGVSVPTLAKRMGDLTKKQGLILKYRVLQSLHLTELQARILECITPEKIAEASLRDLVMAFKILKDKELVVEGKPSEIKGLVSYLIEIEKEEAAKNAEEITEAEVEEVDEVVKDINNPDYVPEF